MYSVFAEFTDGISHHRNHGNGPSTSLVRDNFKPTDDFVPQRPVVPWRREVVLAGLQGVYRSDGTRDGTEIIPGTEGRTIHSPVLIMGELVFFWEATESGMDLWKTNGAAPGTQRVESLPGVDGISRTEPSSEHIRSCALGAPRSSW
ncbi:MAG: hypothetical protein P8R42_05535 [Candidatus Binatia bacterium]|nr:hypothetical protein [Candidatus Binatia bacterium]